MAEKVSVLIELRDAFSRGMGAINREVATFQRKIDQELKGPLGALTGRLAALGGAVGAVGLSKLGQDAEESGNRFRQVFGPEAGRAADAVDALATAVGRSRLELGKTAATFQTFFVGLGIAAPRARELSLQLSQLAIDFASFNNLSDQEASDRFISALSGSSEVLDKFGVNLRVAALDQELLAQGLGKTAQKASESEKVLGRIGIITKSLGRQGAIGDAERTADSFANQLKRVQGEAIDAAAALGGELNKALLPFLKDLGELLRGLAEWVKDNQAAVRSLIDLAIQVGKVVIAFKALQIGLSIFRILSGVGPLLVGVAKGLFGVGAGATAADKGMTKAAVSGKAMLSAIGSAVVAAGIALVVGKLVELKIALDELADAQQELERTTANKARVDAILAQVQALEAVAKAGKDAAATQLAFIRANRDEGFDGLVKRLQAVRDLEQAQANGNNGLKEAIRLMDEFGASAEVAREILTDGGRRAGSGEAFDRMIRAREAVVGQARAQAIVEREIGDALGEQVEAIERMAQQRVLADPTRQTLALAEAGKQLMQRTLAEMEDVERQIAAFFSNFNYNREQAERNRNLTGTSELPTGLLEREQEQIRTLLVARDALREKEASILAVLLDQLAAIGEKSKAEAEAAVAKAAEAQAKEREAATEKQALEAAREQTALLYERRDQTSELARLRRQEQETQDQIRLGTLSEADGIERLLQIRRESLALQLQEAQIRLSAAADVAARASLGGDLTRDQVEELNALYAERNAILDQIDDAERTAASERRTLAAAQEAAQLALLVAEYRNWLAVTDQVVGSNLADFFDDILTGTKSAKEAFADFARGVLRDFTRLVAQMLAQRAVLAAVGLFFPGATVAASAAGAFNEGGPVPGPAGPDRDSVMAALTPGEFVVRRSAVRRLGLGALHAINQGLIPRNLGGPIPSLPRTGIVQALNAGGPVMGAAAADRQPERVLVASEHAFEQMLAGGRGSQLRFLRDNASEVKAALGLS